jgi:TnpA family transposase
VNPAPAAIDDLGNPPEATERLPDEIDADTLRKYFTLTRLDLEEVEQCRGAVNKVGFAIQLCTLRWQGYFLPDARNIPPAVIETIASQTGVLPLPIDGYPQNEKTRFEHLERVRRYLGFIRCDAVQRDRLLNHLTGIAQAMPRSEGLRQTAYRWLKQEKIVRPGRTTIRDLITSAREAALQNAYRTLTSGLASGQAEQIESLLATPSSSPKSQPVDEPPADQTTSRSRLEQFKTVARKESPEALLVLTDQLSQIRSVGVTAWPALADVHPATRRLLAGWGYRYNVWHLRRFSAAKRNAIVICFLQAARAETTDAIIDMQDKLITSIHNKARKRYDGLLRAAEEARSRAVEVVEELGTLVLNDSIPDDQLRKHIFALLPSDDITRLVEGCRILRAGNDGSPLGLIHHWYGYTRKYSPELLEKTPFQFVESSPLGRAVIYLRKLNLDTSRKVPADAPIDFLPRRWVKHVVRNDGKGTEKKGDEKGDENADPVISRPHYELALLTTLNERLKSGDVTVSYSRRWTDFEEYLIPRSLWAAQRAAHYANLGLPLDVDTYLAGLNDRLKTVTEAVDKRAPQNKALTIDGKKGEFHLAAMKAADKPDAVGILKRLIESKLPKIDLVDILIDIDNRTNFLRHFLHGGDSGLSPAGRRRNVLAAVLAIGCNIGCQRMALASGLNFHEISFVTDWYLTEDTLKAACIDIINFAFRLPVSKVYGRGATCSADGMRFYVPIHILAADYSHVLQGRGVTLYAHTADNFLRMNQQPIPCRLREAAFSLDGLMEHDTELDPRVCYTDTHGYTEVVMATAALLGFELAPRIKDINDQTLYKIDRQQIYPALDPILSGTIKPNLIRAAWDETVRVIASIEDRIVSPSLVLSRLGSYARQNSVYQCLAEIGRVHKTVHILKTLDDEEYRRRMGRELNKGEASHDLSRFLCFGKEGVLRGREFGDQVHTFSCLSILHNAVVAWNMIHIATIVADLRIEGHHIDDETLSHVTPLMRKHINPFGRYHFDLSRMRQDLDRSSSPAA